MYGILMDVCCLCSRSEALPDREECVERAIENLITLALLNLFESALIVIEGIRVVCLPATLTRPALCSFQAQAVCSQTITGVPADMLEVRLEATLSCALLERFSAVIVNTISVQRERDVALDIAALPRSV